MGLRASPAAGCAMWICAIWMLVCTSCVNSAATSCGDQVCPIGRACANGHCVDDAIFTACQQRGEGAACEVSTLGAGTCQTGMCIVGTCGDGVINAIDACDGAELGGKTCLDFGSSNADGLACTADCSFDPAACTAFCGDGKKDSTEECDGEDFAKTTCITKGFYEGELACTDQCTINAGGCTGMCGDTVRNGLEPCDGVDFGGDSCQLRGFLGTVTPLTCTAECSFDPASCSCGGELCAPRTERCVLRNGIFTCERA